jgi:hypothetical protein
MQNRRERRAAERQFGLTKAEKNMSRKQLEEIRERKREYTRQAALMRAQEEENRRVNEEAELWAQQLESFMKSGMSRERAEEILTNNRELQEKRTRELAERKQRQKN